MITIMIVIIISLGYTSPPVGLMFFSMIYLFYVMYRIFMSSGYALP